MRYFVPLSELRRRCTVPQVLGLVGWKATRGDRGPCPICSPDRPNGRAFWHSERGWYCHACHKGGGVFDLWAAISGRSIRDSHFELLERLGLLGPEERSAWDRPSPGAPVRPSPSSLGAQGTEEERNP